MNPPVYPQITKNCSLCSKLNEIRQHCLMIKRLFRTKVGHNPRHNDCHNYDQLAVCVGVAGANPGKSRSGPSRCDRNGSAKL